jgi:hypothetical protein
MSAVMSVPPQPYSAVFFVEVLLTGRSRIIATILAPLPQWKLWIHSQDHHDYFFQIHKDTQNGQPIPNPLPEQGWTEREKLKMRDNCRLVGLTTQSFAEIEEKGENPRRAFEVGM